MSFPRYPKDNPIRAVPGEVPEQGRFNIRNAELSEAA
jgi:hypothetical protein